MRWFSSIRRYAAQRASTSQEFVVRTDQAFAAILTLTLLSAGAWAQPADADSVNERYPDFSFLPKPNEYPGRVFRLSQRFPKQLPTADERPAFLQIDFKQQWREYLLAARGYCFQGNIGGQSPEDDFDVAEKSPAQWFHMPWQHYGPKGREGVHGLTKEAPVAAQQLAVTQTYDKGQTYAVAFYNRFGGYTIGQVWADKEHPDKAKAKFPIGTVVFKLLFTDVPVEEVPYLSEPLYWTGYITKEYRSQERTFKRLALIQMDLMVRDERAPFGWVFGTYQYNGKQGRPNKWENLVPVGIQWGNDPQIATDEYTNGKPERTRINPDLKETIINPHADELPPTHLGWNGRLNGPVDNYQSSCMSCHMTAQAPVASPAAPIFLPRDQVPPVGSTTWMRWFQNLKCGERFDPDKPVTSADFSLQMSQGLQNFYDWRNAGTKWQAEQYTSRQRRPESPEDAAENKIQRSIEEG
jgi:hypothetical protein